MTACVNRKHTKKVAAVVTASLVGALGLGVAPISAMAEDTGIDMLVGTEADAFSRGDVKLGGSDVEYENGIYTAKANGDGSAIDFTVKAVKPLGADKVKVDDDYKVSVFKADEDGNPVGDAISSVVEPGRYVVTVEALDGTYAGGTAKVQLNVKAAELKILSAYEVNPDDANDTKDDKLVFTGSELNVGFAGPEGVAFTEGEDYTVKILEVGTDNVETAEGVEVVDAGTYVAYVTGIGQYAGDTAEYTFEVAPFEFDAENVTVDDVIGSDTKPVHPTKVTNGKTGSEYAELDPSLVTLSYKSYNGEDGDESDLFDKNGEYTFLATPNADEVKAENITGVAGDITVNKVGAAAEFLYDGEAIEDSYTVVLNDKESFKVNKLTAKGGEDKLSCTVKAVNSDGEDVTEALTANETGTYTVTVSVDPETTGYEYGGSFTFTVRIILDTIDADANVFIYKDGEAITSFEKTYDSESVKLSNFVVKAFTDDNVNVTEDVELKMYDADGKEITEATDAGVYTLKVVSDSDYELTGTTEITITIAQKAFSDVDIANLVSTDFGAVNANYDYLEWTEKGTAASALDFTHFVDADEDGKVDEGEIEEFPAENYFTVTITKDGQKVDKATDEGVYAVHFEAKDDKIANNYVVPADIEFTVVKAEHTKFIDVTWADYFADPVAEVSDAGYMNGYSDSDLFGSSDQLTRGQVACILFNLAQENPSYNENGLIYVEGIGWKSFDDVDGTQYYGKAVAWAKQNGVVNGYGDGTFKADEPVTREEFAAMLANYAEKFDSSYSEADSAVLDEFDDASTVSGWAEGVVAWAVENGVMGNGGFLSAQTDIIRADAACMVYNYAIAE